MGSIPTNVIPYLIGALATFVVGVRSTQNYHKFRSPLSRHFAISGFLASAGLFLYSVPFIFGLSGDSLRSPLLLGRFFLDLVAYIQVYLIWYLTSLRRVSLGWLALPATAIFMIGYAIQVKYLLTASLGVVNGSATTEFVATAAYFHAFALLIVFCAGLILAKNAFVQNDTRGKVRLFSVALLYMAASASDFYGAIFLGGLNNSWVVLAGFLVASGGFLLTSFLFTDRKETEKK